MWAEAIGFEPMGHSRDLRFSRPAHSTTLPNLQIDTLGLHSTTLPTFLDKIRLIVKAEREGFEPPDPLLSVLRGPTIASLIKTSYICLRAINSKANRLHIRCKITFTSFQSITTFIYLEVQILTAFLFHSPHHVALRTYDLNRVFATTRSSNCLFSMPVG